MQLWRSPYNAEVYERFVQEHGVYPWLNRTLVEIAELSEARRVLDIGCGTGDTSRAVLRVLRPDGGLVAVDASPAMAALTRLLPDPRLEVEVMAAAEVHALDGRFDAAVSNAAFWQVPHLGSALGSVARCLHPGGRFTFNLPEEVLGAAAPTHPFQAALSAELLNQGLDVNGVRGNPRLSAESLDALAAARGLTLRRRQRLSYRCPQGELIELMGIPVMLERLAPTLRAEDREAAWRRARARCDPSREVEVPWVVQVYVRERG